MPKKFTSNPQIDAEMRELVALGLNATRIAKKIGISKWNVDTRAKELELLISKGWQLWGKEKEDKLIHLRSIGLSNQSIADELKMNLKAVCAKIAQLRLSSRLRFVTKEEIELIKKYIKEGDKIDDIAIKLNRPKRTIESVLYKEQIQSEISSRRTINKTLGRFGLRKCWCCKETKPVNKFIDSRGGCDMCRKKKLENLSPQKFLERLLESCKSRTKSNGTKFDLDLPFLLNLYETQKELCYYTGVKMVLEPYKENQLSIDRIDSKGSYTKDNVVLCCSCVNIMKMDLPMETFIKYCKMVAIKHG